MDEKEKNLRDIRAKTIFGAMWVSVGSGYRYVSQFVFSVVLARLLTPVEFGLVAIVMAILSLVRGVILMGLGTAIVRRKKHDQGYYDTAFTLQMVAATVLAIILAAIAPLLAKIYQEEQLIPLMRLSALQFVLMASYSVVRGYMRRELEFRKITVIEIVGSTLSGSIGIVCAWQGLGVYSLVIMLLSEYAISSFLAWAWVACRPRLRIDREHVRELLNFGAHMSATMTFYRATKTMDRMLIGRFFRLPEPGYQVGIYGRAHRLMLMPVIEIGNMLFRVFLPALSKIQDDHKLFRGAFVRAISMVALITFPMMAGLYAVREHFIICLYTEKWADVIPIVRILCVVGAVQSVTSASRMIYLSLGKTKQFLYFSVWTNSAVLVGFGVGIWSGSLINFALIYMIVNLALHPFMFIFPGRLIGLTYGAVVKALSGIAVCSLLMSFAVVGMDILLRPRIGSHMILLLVETGFGVLLYLGLIHVAKLPMYFELREIVKEKFDVLLGLLKRKAK